MSKDISSQYTKYCNIERGRNGYCGAQREKETVISPKNYGMYLQRTSRRK